MDQKEARAIVERAHLISDLANHPSWSVLVSYVNETARAKQHIVLNSGCKDIEDYRRQTGWLEGVAFVMDAAARTEEQARKARAVLTKGA